MDINLTNPVTTAKIGEVVNGASAATPNDTDLLPVIESSVTKKLTLTNLKAFLKTYFDTLYSNLGYTAENVANKSSSYTLSSTTTYANTKALVDGLATKEPLKGSDDNYVTDAQLVVIQNTSGTNSGDNATNSTSNTYADGKVADSITNGVTTIAPSQNAVFDALALKANLTSSLGRKYFAYDNTTYSYTGTTANTIVRTIYIPTGTMGLNSTLELFLRFTKTGTAGTSIIRMYITTDPSSLTGGAIYGVYSVSATFLQYGKYFRLTNKNSLSTQLYTTAVSQDFYTPQTTALLSGTIDFSVDQYIHIYMSLSSSADTHGITDYQCYIDNP